MTVSQTNTDQYNNAATLETLEVHLWDAVYNADVSFNSGHYTVIIKRQFLCINICSFSTIFVYMFALELGQECHNLPAKQKGFSLVT